MKLYTVLGCVTDIEGAQPYMCQPHVNRDEAVDYWYFNACENIGVHPNAFPPASAEHEALMDAAYSLRTIKSAILYGEILTLRSFQLDILP